MRLPGRADRDPLTVTGDRVAAEGPAAVDPWDLQARAADEAHLDPGPLSLGAD